MSRRRCRRCSVHPLQRLARQVATLELRQGPLAPAGHVAQRKRVALQGPRGNPEAPRSWHVAERNRVALQGSRASLEASRSCLGAHDCNRPSSSHIQAVRVNFPFSTANTQCLETSNGREPASRSLTTQPATWPGPHWSPVRYFVVSVRVDPLRAASSCVDLTLACTGAPRTHATSGLPRWVR